jgi:hypothetical protein
MPDRLHQVASTLSIVIVMPRFHLIIDDFQACRISLDIMILL